MADKRISQLVERVNIANNDVLPIVASGATTTNKVTVSTLQDWMQSNLDVGVTSVGLSMPSAFVVSNSPVTGSGNISVTGAGTVSQYIRGDGSLADFPSGGGGGGSSVNYYLNGSVSQGTIGGIAYKEMNRVPVIGAGTDFVAIADGYLASFITDAGDPALLEIPAGNWNFETYFSASSGGGTPSFYVELYKVDSGGTATLIASNSATPELIAFGTTITPYFSTLAVPTTSLAITDRLALRYYVARSGRTITLHTENSHLCQIITTFTTGLTALNGLTAQVQNFATGTSGTDFAISSSVSTHTFNLPTASATNRGALSSADFITFNSKIGGTISTGQVAFGTAANTVGGSNNLFWDNANGRLGIATNSPKSNLDVIGSTGIFQRDSSGGSLVFDETDIADASTPMSFIRNIAGALQFGRANRNPANGLSTNSTTSWQMTNTGVLQSNGAQTIQTSTGNLTLTSADNTGFVDIRRNNRALGAELRLTNAFSGSGWLVGDIVGTLNFVTADDSTTPIRAQIQAISTGGISYPAAMNLTFSTANLNTLTEGFRLTNLGNLHIGTFTGNVGGRLQVSASSYLDSRLKLTNTITGGNIWSISSGSEDVSSTLASLFTISNQTTNKTNLVLDNLGRMLLSSDLGTSTPNYNFQIADINSVLSVTDTTSNNARNSSIVLRATNDAGIVSAESFSFALPLILRTSNTDRLTINGSTGAATFSSTARIEGQFLQVINATQPSVYINNTAVQWRSYLNSNNYAISDAVRDVLTLGYNGSPSFFQGCNVGIGTASPNTKLEVVGGNNLPPSTGTQNYTIALRDPTSMVADVGGSIIFQGYKTSTSAIGNFGYIAGKKENGTAGNEAGYLSLGTFDSSGIPSEKMRITSGGNTNILGNLELTSGTNRSIILGSATNYNYRLRTTGDDFAINEAGSTDRFKYVYADTRWYITGGLTISGSISKGSGSFKIDHPLPEKKDTHHLVHSFVEAPQADNIYRGKIDLLDGYAEVNIDEASGMSEGTFVLLNGNIQCFTSNEKGWTAIRGKVEGNILKVEAQDSKCTDTISWLVIGERIDQHMIDTDWTDENGKVIVEPLKKQQKENEVLNEDLPNENQIEDESNA